MSKETIYTIGTHEDRESIIDFINYVFSNAYYPHNFKLFFPGLYGDHITEMNAKHFLAKQNGRIRALVAGRTKNWHVLKDELRVGTIGNVSVHPYARGEGHMKQLMADAMADAREQGCDLLILNGKRQRYNYFGFEQAGWFIRYTMTQDSVRHALGSIDASKVEFISLTEEMTAELDYAWNLHSGQAIHVERPRDEFLDIMHEIEHDFRLIFIDGKMCGYIMGHGEEIVLDEECLLPKVIKALFKWDNLDNMAISVPPWQKERMAVLSSICDKRSISHSMMIRVLSWKKIIETLLRLKSSFAPLQDGVLILSVEGETIRIKVQEGCVTVETCEQTPELVYDHLEAQRALFDLESFSSGGVYRNWFPLPLYFFPPDEF